MILKDLLANLKSKGLEILERKQKIYTIYSYDFKGRTYHIDTKYINMKSIVLDDHIMLIEKITGLKILEVASS